MPANLLDIDIDALIPDLNQPRKTFVPEELARLADSIRSRGVLQPLRVSFDQEHQKWRVITGESRWKAAVLAQLPKVPCLVVDAEVDPSEILLDQVTENALRNALRPTELARALARLKAMRGWTGQALAAETGLSGATISRLEKLLGQPPELQAMVDAGTLGESTAYEISHLGDPADQLAMAEAAAQGKLTRHQVIDRVRAANDRDAPTPGDRPTSGPAAKGKASRLGLKFEDLSITVSSGQPLAWKGIIDALELLVREAKALSSKGKPVSVLADVLRAR